MAEAYCVPPGYDQWVFRYPPGGDQIYSGLPDPLSTEGRSMTYWRALIMRPVQGARSVGMVRDGTVADDPTMAWVQWVRALAALQTGSFRAVFPMEYDTLLDWGTPLRQPCRLCRRDDPDHGGAQCPGKPIWPGEVVVREALMATAGFKPLPPVLWLNPTAVIALDNGRRETMYFLGDMWREVGVPAGRYGLPPARFSAAAYEPTWERRAAAVALEPFGEYPDAATQDNAQRAEHLRTTATRLVAPGIEPCMYPRTPWAALPRQTALFIVWYGIPWNMWDHTVERATRDRPAPLQRAASASTPGFQPATAPVEFFTPMSTATQL
jgi:hypothetical protein